MGKTANKQGQVGASLPPLPQKDLCQRVNFAVQASTYLHSLGVGSSSGRNGKRKASTPNGSSDRVQSGPSLRSEVDFGALARSNMNATKKMAAHTQLKLDPFLKRAMCRGCGTYLIPGLTSRIRNRPHKRTIHITHTSCLHCLAVLSLPAPPVLGVGLDLDGPVRRKRREGASKRSKVVFHERERDDGGGSGHTLWMNDDKAVGWGERPSEASSAEGASGPA